MFDNNTLDKYLVPKSWGLGGGGSSVLTFDISAGIIGYAEAIYICTVLVQSARQAQLYCRCVRPTWDEDIHICDESCLIAMQVYIKTLLKSLASNIRSR